MYRDVKTLVGELDFSFHAVSTVQSLASSTRSSLDGTRPNTPRPKSAGDRDREKEREREMDRDKRD